MNLTAAGVEKALRSKINKQKAEFYPRFFKTGKGQYGEGDKFLGVVVPEQRKIAHQFKSLPESQIVKLLNSPLHECRLTGLLIMVHQFQAAKTEAQRKSVYELYFKKMDRVNNWDLVDASAHKIVGAYLYDRGRRTLYRLARSRNLWKIRIAIVATYYFIKQGDVDDTIEICETVLDHEHDLIHKAAGWMLREVGKQDQSVLIAFLRRHHQQMPRTMLRYAIEKLPKAQRQRWMASEP